MMNKQNVPELRFPEFSGEWEKERVNKLADINPKTEKIADKFLYIDLDSVKKGRLISEKIIDITKAPSRAQRVLEAGDILFQTVRPYQKNHLLMKENYGTLQVVSSTGFAQLKTKNLISEQFIYQLVNTNKFSYEVEKRCTGTSYPAINSKDLGQIEIYHPSYEEQRKIGDFFSKVDRLIELEEKKLELLEEQKKGYMQKIFTQELRFKDENGNDYPEWEEKKLGEILGERVERSANGELLSVTISEGIKPFSQLDRKNNSSDNKDNYKKVYVGDIAYNSMRMWQGASGYSPYEGIVSPAYTVLYRKSEIDMEFISYYFKTYQLVHTFKKFSQGLTSDTWNLKYPLLKTIPVYICSLNEQKKILSFFVKLDYRINQQKIKVNKMKLEKQGLIQRMFL